VDSFETVSHYLGESMLEDSYRLAGRLDDATRLAPRALGLARKRQGQGYEARAILLLGDVDTHRDPHDIERAATYAQQALAFNALDMHPPAGPLSSQPGRPVAGDGTGRAIQRRTDTGDRDV